MDRNSNVAPGADALRTGPDLVATCDQAHEETRQKARLVGAYWVGLKAEGVDDYDCTQLAGAFAERLFFTPPEPDPSA